MYTLKSIIDGVVSISTVPSSTENLTKSKDNHLKKTPSKRKSASTLKFLVSQSLLDQDLLPEEHRFLLTSHYKKSQVKECKSNRTDVVKDECECKNPSSATSNFVGQIHENKSEKITNCSDNKSNENYSPSPKQRKRSRSRTTAGSGDIAPASVVQGSQSRDKKHVGHLLSTVYEKGSEFLLAIFGEEQNEILTEKDILEEKSVLSKSEHSPKFHYPTQVNDTAYYNGYGIRVKGQGVKLDTLFVNGSGPSGNSMEIHISLLHDTNTNGNLNGSTRSKATIQSVYQSDPEESRLTIKYINGVFKGFIQITCPLEMNVNELKIEHKGNCLIITAP